MSSRQTNEGFRSSGGAHEALAKKATAFHSANCVAIVRLEEYPEARAPPVYSLLWIG
jgi:hypothetical protein